MDGELRNWAGNYRYSAQVVHRPSSVEEIQQTVAAATRVKALGTRHSFNSIADSTGEQIQTSGLNRVLELDRENSTVTVEGGITYGALGEFLDREGFALSNLASLPHISVAGSVATATHGSGVGNQNLSAAVRAIEVVVADGSIVRFAREDGDRFLGAVVALGGLGIVVRLTLDLVPSFQVAQVVYENLPMAAIETDLGAILSDGYSVSLFTEWNSDSFKQVWVKRIAGEPFQPTFFGATRAESPRHMLDGMPLENCTPQLGIPGPWHHRLPHFKMEFTPSGGEELQTEFFVKRSDGAAAIRAISELGREISPHLYVTEIRTVAADEMWLSPAYRQDCIAIHFTWKQHIDEVNALVPKIEAVLAPFKPRPHWGKIFRMPASHVAKGFPRISDFRTLLQEFDTHGKFRNDYLNRCIFGDD